MTDSPLAPVLSYLRQLAGPHAIAGQSDALLLERFVAHGDSAALEMLLRRHGPLVWRVCRRLLRREQDAEDAFQATFLALAQRAGSIRKPESLSSFLHGTAYRIARRTWEQTNRQLEPRSSSPAAALDPVGQASWRELGQVIEEEVHALPEGLRAALLLCYWDGLTNEEAARRLGCPCGTLKTRLAKARKVLHDRLTHRGVTMPSGVIALLLAPSGAETAVPLALSAAALRAASAAETSARVAALAMEGGRYVTLTRGMIGLLLLVVGTAVGMRALAYRAPVAAEKNRDAPWRPAKEAAAAHTDRLGDPLPPGALLRLGTIRFRPGDTVNALAFLPGGDTLVSTGFEGIYFWDVAKGKQRRRIKLTPPWIGPFALSPDGKIIACREGASIRVWETSTGKELRPLKTKAACLAFAHDGRRLASVDDKNTLTIWDWRNRKEERRVLTKQWRINQVGFGVDDRSVYTWDMQNLSAWDAASGKPLRPCRYPTNIRIFSSSLDQLVLSPDGKLLARSIHTQPIRIYETGTWRELRQLRAGDVSVSEFTPNGKGLLVGGTKGIALWDVARGKEIYRIAEGGVPAFTADGRLLALCGLYRGSIRLYDAATGKRLRPLLPGHDSSTGALAFSPDGRLLATRGEDDDTVRLWDARSGKPLHVFGEPGAGIANSGYSLAFSPDGTRLAWGDWGGRVHVVDPHTGRALRRWVIDKKIDTIHSVYFSADGRSLVTASAKNGFPGQPSLGLCQVWETATGKELARSRLASGEPTTPPRLSPDGRMVLVHEGEQWLLRDPIRNRELARLSIPKPVSFLFAFSADGRLLVGATEGKDQLTLHFWETASGTEVRTITTRAYVNSRLALSADGRLLALGGPASIDLWDVATGQRVLLLRGHGVPVSSLYFAPDGRTLASGLADTSVLIWDLSPFARRGNPAPTPRELEQLWFDLGSAEGPKAYRALWALADSKQSIDLLSKHLRPATEADLAGLRRLLDDLNSDSFQTRERASRELERHRLDAEPILEKALKGKPSPEARRRILDVLRHPRRSSPELLRRLRAVQVLERLGTPRAREILRQLAGGAPGAALTKEAQQSLARLTRRP